MGHPGMDCGVQGEGLGTPLGSSRPAPPSCMTPSDSMTHLGPDTALPLRAQDCLSPPSLLSHPPWPHHWGTETVVGAVGGAHMRVSLGCHVGLSQPQSPFCRSWG